MNNIKNKTFHLWLHCYCYNNRYILAIKRRIKSNFLSNIILFISLPCLLSRWAILIIGEQIYAIRNTNNKNKLDINKNFKHEFAIVCIAKNEGPYIKEWIDYHKLIGVEKIYFYDNESTDNTINILKSYINNGIVTYTKIIGHSKQLDAYNDALKKYKNDCRYMAFLDLDEYLFRTSDSEVSISESISRLLIKAGGGASGIGVNWCLFGSAGLKTRPQGLITENYIYRGEAKHWGNYHIKTICNPRRVSRFISPHYPLYELGAYNISDGNLKRLYGWFCHDVQWKYFRINHYYCKSEEDYKIKISRGFGDRLGEYDMSQFKKYDLNNIKDNGMLKFTQHLHN